MSWTGKSEGGVLGFRIFVYSIKTFGIAFAYFILKFVSYYFYLFLSEKKKFLNDFYQQRLGYSPRESKRLIKKNFLLLGQGLIDKIAFLTGRGERIGYEEKGEGYLKELVSKKQGAFLISAHVGNWDIAGNFLSVLGAKVHVLMFENEKEEITSLLLKEGVEPNFNIIPIKDDLSHFIGIYNAIKKGEFVCLHADRFLPGDPTINLSFLGGQADFPLGVFQIIEKLKAHYSFVFMVKKDTWLYSFSATKPIIAQKSAEEIARDFIPVLEKKVREYPEQWFNYYDFYQKNNDRLS
jgi:predicted LPLAT superfamily acyltransferase